MRGPTRAALIDLDGTLVDSRGDLVAAVNALLAEMGREPLSEEVVTGFIGRGARNLVTRSLEASGGPPGDVPEGVVLRWLDLYGDRCLDRTRPYPGAVAALEALLGAGWRLGVVTNKPSAPTGRILAALGLATRFDVVLGGDSLPERKPSGTPLRHALDVLGVAARDAWMVGDSDVDVLAGRAAGVRTVGCLWGIGDRDRLLRAGPDALARAWEDVPGPLMGSPPGLPLL